MDRGIKYILYTNSGKWEKGGARYNAFMRRGTVVEDLGESLPMIGRSQKQRGRSECYQSVTVGKEKIVEILLFDSLSLLLEGTGNGIIKTIAWSGNGRVDTRGHSERKEPFVGKIMGYNGSSISGVWTRKSGQEREKWGSFHIGGSQPAAGRWRRPYGRKRLNFHPISKSAITHWWRWLSLCDTIEHRMTVQGGNDDEKGEKGP